jgi:uncharacterized protein (TIGR03086 family)
MDTSAQHRFIRANTALDAVIGQINQEQMDLAVPAELRLRPNQTLRGTMNLLAYENLCVPEVLGGADKLATNPEFTGDLLEDDPQGNYRRYSAAANQAAAALDDPDRIVHISYGDFPASDYLRDITIQRGMSACDVARLIGADTTLPDDVVQDLWDIIEPIAGYLREFGVFGPEVDVPEDAPLQDRLLGLTGRQP